MVFFTAPAIGEQHNFLKSTSTLVQYVDIFRSSHNKRSRLTTSASIFDRNLRCYFCYCVQQNEERYSLNSKQIRRQVDGSMHRFAGCFTVCKHYIMVSPNFICIIQNVNHMCVVFGLN